ncbi:hypothetical protein FQV39_25450 [Bosea sp. F3-2]|uniref:YciI family protein n=1 Tax=Bosea sp. F3-2 TaxID=2599640 RepID=UPI0011ECAFA4|nr:YciI family protein [Bosea sp. F3-2]QEL25567.1 hypothetical protein FQV39_25450 [Bosea sp. F3-2]
MPYFFCRLLPPRPGFPGDASAEELRLMQEHGTYWREQAARGIAIAFGPVLDPAGAWGLGVAEASGEDEIRMLTEGDPVIRAGLGFRFEIHPMPSLILRDAQSSARNSA